MKHVSGVYFLPSKTAQHPLKQLLSELKLNFNEVEQYFSFVRTDKMKSHHSKNNKHRSTFVVTSMSHMSELDWSLLWR